MDQIYVYDADTHSNFKPDLFQTLENVSFGLIEFGDAYTFGLNM